MDDEDLHPIEQDDEIVAPEVLQVVEEHQAAPNQDPESDEEVEVTAAMVYNRIGQFQLLLQAEWDDFKETLLDEINNVRFRIQQTTRHVELMNNYDRRVVDFAIGDLVVLLEERKVGRVTKVTTLYVDVLLDGEQNSKKTVRKKKTAVMRLYS